MSRSTGGLYLLIWGVLLVGQVTDVSCWGGWNRITEQVSRTVSQAGSEIKKASEQVGGEIKKVSTQVINEADKVGKTVNEETNRWGDDVGSQVGSWFPSPSDESIGGVLASLPEAPAVELGCPPLISVTVEYACRTSGRTANCSVPMAVGTVVQLRCRQGYQSGQERFPTSINCMTDLKWSGSGYSCVPDCGKRNAAGQSSKSRKPQPVEFPWHVTIHKLNAAGEYDVACGGTLITPTLVLSAATCFWDASTNKKLPAAQFKTSAGRPRVDDALTQRRDVIEVLVHERYAGRARRFDNNVAVARLAQAMVISDNVNLACVDWIHDHEDTVEADGRNGMVAFWNAIPPSSAPGPLQLPFVPFVQCSDAIDADYLDYVTDDKFCAGSVDKTVSVCPTDAGVGFTLPLHTVRGTRYYLRGIASTRLDGTLAEGECGTQKLAVFTHFSTYRKWLETIAFNGQGL